jgi:hypothetical protein
VGADAILFGACLVIMKHLSACGRFAYLKLVSDSAHAEYAKRKVNVETVDMIVKYLESKQGRWVM